MGNHLRRDGRRQVQLEYIRVGEIMTHSLAQFAAALTGSMVKLAVAEHHILEHACKVIEKEAKSYAGHYQTGWPALRPETIAKKANGDTPLLETGELRDSYEHKVEGSAGYVGSNNMKAVYHEFGTSRGIPPRPILSLASMTKEAEVHELTGRGIHAVLLTALK
jgi:phage gpG-like protein